MSKFISVFEKLNLIEKTNKEANDSADVNNVTNEENISDMDNVNPKDEIESKNIEEDSNNTEYQYSEAHEVEIEVPEKVNCKPKSKLPIEDIYSLYNIENSNINTIFMAGNFINAIPESLPHEVRKKSVISIINSSNIDFNHIISDGEKRLEVLEKFSDQCYNETVSTIKEHKVEIEKLKKLISEHEEKIQMNEILLKEQINIVKYEAEKINNIINFFNNDK
ncbi:MAG: hypothetical protein Q8936_18510 [Bacillota bacterium]|nr:hypothetical protein [Bacillota bacterium]